MHNPSFEGCRGIIDRDEDQESAWYCAAVQSARVAAGRAGVAQRDIAAVSVFSTQSISYFVSKVREQIFSGPPPAPIRFDIGPGGSRAVFPMGSVAGLRFGSQDTTRPALTFQDWDMRLFNVVAPRAVGMLAYGRMQAPDYMVHPGEYIPEIATRTGVPAVQGTLSIPVEIALPSGTPPPGGWPVAILDHGSGLPQHEQLITRAPLAAERGLATITFSNIGNGRGPLSTLTIRRTDGTSVTIPSPGRGIDQNGDGLIATQEGHMATAPRLLQTRTNATLQHVAELIQLVRIIQVGIDVDGDGVRDLNPDRIYSSGYSLGAMNAFPFVAVTPEIRGAALTVPAGNISDNQRLGVGPRARGANVGAALGGRVPSLLNSEFGLTQVGGWRSTHRSSTRTSPCATRRCA